MDSYYIIKKRTINDNSWQEDDLITVYLYGKSSFYDWCEDEADAKKFKSISGIRTFITNSMKTYNEVDEVDIATWTFHRVNVIPSSEIITSIHTMGLLRRVVE
jgi:hypothetical protein